MPHTNVANAAAFAAKLATFVCITLMVALSPTPAAASGG
jgi:hypothetical protein